MARPSYLPWLMVGALGFALGIASVRRSHASSIAGASENAKALADKTVDYNRPA